MAAKKKKSAKQNIFNKVHLSFKEREYFTENLSLLLKASVPVGEAIDSLMQTTKSKATKTVLTGMQADIEAGYGLADALERSGIVSAQTLALIRLGERSGHLVENMQLAAQQEEKRHASRSKVRSALIYPVFVLGLTIVIGLGIAWFLLPKLSNTFSQIHVKLPLISVIMINFGNFLQAYGLVAVPLAIGVGLLLGYVLFGAPKTKFIGQRILFKTPGIGRLMKEVEIAQFGYLLGTLLDAGLPITQAVELLAGASTSRQHQLFYRDLAQHLTDGFSMKDSMSRYKKSGKLLPLAMQQMITAGERSGSLAEVLLTIGHTYEQKSDITTENLEALMEPVLLLFVAGGVMLVAVAVILPIYSLVGGLGA